MATRDESVYDPRAEGETIVLSDVSLMPDFLGFSAVRTIALCIVCIFLLTPALITIWLLPVMLVIDALIFLVALILAVITPSHVSTLQYLRCRRAERNGRETIVSDPFNPRDRNGDR